MIYSYTSFFPLSTGIKLADSAVSTIKPLSRRVGGTIRLLSEKKPLLVCQEERRPWKDLGSRDVADWPSREDDCQNPCVIKFNSPVRLHFHGNNSSLSQLLSYLFSSIGGKRKTGKLPQPLPCLADKPSLAKMEREFTSPEHVGRDTCICPHSGEHTEHARSALLKE